MEENTNAQEQAVSNLYNYTLGLLTVQKKKGWEVKKMLIEDGASEEVANKLVDTVKAQYNAEVNKKANKEMLVGGLWCVGGTVVTVVTMAAATGGYVVAWGAIIFGAIQFFRGYSLKQDIIY